MQANAARLAFGRRCYRLRSPSARQEGDFSLPEPVNGVIMAPKLTESGECRINSLACEHDARLVMAISEPDILLLNRHAASLAGVKLLVPDAKRMARVLDKRTTYEIAAKVGIEMPQTWQVASPGEIDTTVASIAAFPVVLKWPDPGSAVDILARHGLRLLKCEYAHERSELRRILQRYIPAGIFPLIQEFCPGYGLGQMLLMHDGQAKLRFQHRRLHEWPPEGGFSTVCESLPLSAHAELFERSTELLRQLDWHGPAMVEYRFDPATGRARLMEVNGRFWGSLPLAYHSGAYFAWMTYLTLGVGGEAPVAPYRSGIRCRFMVPETRRLLTILFRPERIQDRTLKFDKAGEVFSYLFDFLRPRTRYYVFEFRDPLPLAADLWSMLTRTITSRRRKVRVAGAYPRHDLSDPAEHTTEQ